MGSTTHISSHANRAGSSSVSSDSHPTGRIVSKRSRSSASTARSASLTGDEAPFVQLLSCARKVCNASAPASRTATASRSRNSARSSARSAPGNGQALDAQRRRVRAETEFKIVCRGKRREHIDEIAGNRHFAHWVSAFAVLDPEAGGAAAVVAGHLVDPHANEISDVEAFADAVNQHIESILAGSEVQITGSRRGRRGGAALDMAGRDKTEPARASRSEEPG